MYVWPPQDKQKKRPFPQFPIKDGHGEWRINTISYLSRTEEKAGVPSYWNTHVLQVGHLILFFLCQAYNRSLMTDLSGWTTFILCYFDYVSVPGWWERLNKWCMWLSSHIKCHNCVEVSNFVCGRSWKEKTMVILYGGAGYRVTKYMQWHC